VDRSDEAEPTLDRSTPPFVVLLGRWWPALAPVVLATLTAVVLAHPDPLVGELSYVRWLQRRGEPLATAAEIVRATTGTEASIILAALGAVWSIRRFGEAGVRALLIALVVMLVVQPVFKELVDRPRPNATQVEVRTDHSSKSFPSGHSLSTTTIWGAAAGLAWRRRRRTLAAAALVPIVATGFASAVQGVHWPSDAIAGTLVGLIGAWAIVNTLHPGDG
jgi:membrane-associated phospholipid phosphatase